MRSDASHTTPRYGIVLANTGTPADPTPKAVRSYLSKFLMDKRIAPMNRLVWWFVLHCAILPKRSSSSAEKYRRIWTEEGSPFALAHAKLVYALERALCDEGYDAHVVCAMSYSKPSMKQALRTLQKQGCTDLVVVPLYPQSAYSTTGSTHDAFQRALRRVRWKGSQRFIDNYSGNATYARAIAAMIRHAGFDPDSDDRLLFSYHSIPVKDVEDGDTYELQTGATSLQIAGELGIERTRWTIGYQCRFDAGRQWLAPTSEEVMERWAESGARRVFVVCPGFAVDCLETLLDVNIDLRRYYFDSIARLGGDATERVFVYVPCLDKTKAHIKVLRDIVVPYLEEGKCHER